MLKQEEYTVSQYRTIAHCDACYAKLGEFKNLEEFGKRILDENNNKVLFGELQVRGDSREFYLCLVCIEKILPKFSDKKTQDEQCEDTVVQ